MVIKMGIGLKQVAKGFVSATATAIGYIVIPYSLIEYLQKAFPIAVFSSALIQIIYLLGGMMVVAAFFKGIFPKKTVNHSIVGLASGGLSAAYFYYVIGGAYTGTFGVFSITIGTISILFDFSLVASIILGLILLKAATYLIELRQALRARKAVPPRSMPSQPAVTQPEVPHS